MSAIKFLEREPYGRQTLRPLNHLTHLISRNSGPSQLILSLLRATTEPKSGLHHPKGSTFTKRQHSLLTSISRCGLRTLRRILLALSLDLWLAVTAFLLWDGVHYHRNMLTTTPPSRLV